MKQCQTQPKKNDTRRNASVWTTTSSPSSFLLFVVTFLLISSPCCNAFVQYFHPRLPAKIASVRKSGTKRFITRISSSKKIYLYSTSSTSTTTTISTVDAKNEKSIQEMPIDESKNNMPLSSSSSTFSMNQEKEKNKNKVDKNNENNNDNNNKDVIAPLALLLFSQFLLFIGVGVVIPTIPLYGKEIGLSASASGIVISAPAVALLLGSRMSGQYADMARKPAMIIGMAIIAMSDAGTAFATGLPALIVARLGLGSGRCISEAGERGMLADLASKIPTFRGRALAAQQATVALGIAIGAPFGGVIIEQYGPRSAFLCVTVAAITAMFIYLLLPETIVEQQQHTQTTTAINDKIKEDNRKFLQRESAATAEIESEMMGPSEAVVVNDKDGMPSSALNDEKSDNNKDDGDWSVLIQATQWKGLAACQIGTSFGYAAKIGSIPILATGVLPGGAAGAGILLSAAGLSGILGASIGGVLTDRFTAKFTAIIAGIVSATGLFLIPFALSLSSTSSSADGVGDTTTMMITSIPFMSGEMGIDGITFAMLVIVWSLGASAQGPALTAIAQQLAPPGREATALALPRAAGDATYIFAPFLLGLVTDSTLTAPGAECGVAGVCVLTGVVALAILGGNTMNDNDAIATVPTEQQQQP